MIKIGDFSKISQVSVKTLRFYDEMGILKPVEVDRFTGYRYYTFEQLTRLHRILALKDLGLPLEQIAALLDQGLPVHDLQIMLQAKRSELRKQLQETAARLERVEARLRQLEQETDMPDYEIVIKKVEPLWVAGVRGIIPTYPEQGELWNKLESRLQQANVIPKGPCFTIYHAEEPEIDAEVCELIAGPVKIEDILVHELPAAEQMASIIHHGPMTTLGAAYGALIQWIQNNGYRICGPSREFYIKPPETQSSTDSVTEIQFPIEKV